MLYVICIFSLESWNKNKRASFKKKKGNGHDQESKTTTHRMGECICKLDIR